MAKEKFHVDVEEIEESIYEHTGICIRCGERAYGVEPDARYYYCSECGAHAVFGLEQAILESLIIVDE